LDGLTFVTSGVLRSLESEEAVDLIKRYGGRVTSAVSSKTSYLLLGKDGGKLKSEAAAKHGTKIIDEKQLFDMIAASLPPQAAPASSSASSAAAASAAPAAAAPVSTSAAPAVSAVGKSPVKVKPAAASSPSTAVPSSSSPTVVPRPPLSSSGSAVHGSSSSSSSSSSNPAVPKCSELWTTKHKPNRIEEIVGNPGKVKELQTWLMTWQRYFADEAAAKAAGDKKKKKDDNFMKAVLISGPPGIGKTTAAHIVARACGFCVLEFNASDVRSKSSLHEHVMALASNTTLAMGVPKPPAGPGASGSAAAAAPNGFNGKLQKRNCVIMDEVDGMSSGDRGGIAEIIKIIADCKMPIICICNDYYDAKIKSLRNHCLDMRFSKPTVRLSSSIQMHSLNLCCRRFRLARALPRLPA
jgi:replication factor C subunit 1